MTGGLISKLARNLVSVGPNPAFGFGPGAKAGVYEGKEGGPGSGRRPEGESSSGTDSNSSYKGSRIYQDGKAGVRALTPTGQNVGPFKNENLLKSHLDKFYQSFANAKKEAVSSTAQTAQLKAQKKESETKASSLLSFREASDAPFKNRRFEVILIKEGLGNFKDCFFYTKESLQQAAKTQIFEGVQSFADHPSLIEEESRPERSTKDILGYYEDVKYRENELGQGELVADLVVSDTISLQWAVSLLTNSIEYSKKFREGDLVGLSINARGGASPVNIDEFIKSQSLPEQVLKKLMQAKEQGIDEINVVNELKEAQSVDLVTKAGAGGKILQMLEQEKSMGKKLKESEAKEKHESQEEGKPADADGASADHADADQDKKLFAQMIKQYLGKDDASPEEMEMAQHAHEACKEMGMEGQEAYEAAGTHLKMAMAIGKKMASKQEGQKEAGEAQEAGECKEGEEAQENKEGQTPPPNPKSEGKKESMKLVELSGEVAQLRESLKKYELRDYLDKKLAESGKSNLVTKKFREALGVPKSKEQIDASWKIFVKAYEAGAEEVSEDPASGLFVEKSTVRESSAPTKKSMADCLR